MKNNLPYIEALNENEKDSVPEDVDKILILLVLTHIFMSNNSVTEGIYLIASNAI